MKDAPRSGDIVVMIIHGDHERAKGAEIAADLSGFKQALCIIVGESGEFPVSAVSGPNRWVWQQSPVPGKHDATKRIILGYPPDAPALLFMSNILSVQREYDWFFAGQVTHSHRYACVEQLRRMSRGFLLETAGFWQGMERSNYYTALNRAKIIPCPSGPETPDTFRVWEALEAGCVPIVDASCPKKDFPTGFWEYVLGKPLPFPVISDWKTLPDVIQEELQKWPANRDALYKWWMNYKRHLLREANMVTQCLTW